LVDLVYRFTGLAWRTPFQTWWWPYKKGRNVLSVFWLLTP